eukprot:CAMPEP_0172315394 /NCGR_PEP_ID=MMETSP1058-20130122/25058_1 /TAXON_ID=83371 /ORGANISM="Detonula confervacea, Strain CCMP 353" /LENGTH=647 /DNA_ID=CAMNT_0013029465 /DNA_START=7 /DNA_END=1950 /DNA_ORIENTATION=+
MSSQPTPSDTRPEYTNEQLQNALHNFYGGANASTETCGHIYGYNDPNHEMSMLQKITATTILDYDGKLSSSSSSSSPPPSATELLERAKKFHDAHGPIVPLQQIIQAKSPSMTLAAEFKRASPSKGDIAPHLNAGDQAALYYAAGASVISVLTEERWFKGSLADLTSARMKTTAAANKKENGNRTRPAILRKDFVTSTYQIAEAAAAGADTILLMVSTTPAAILKELITYARSVVGMEPLVEVHALIELDVAIAAGAKVIGVNNRNLHTFQVDMAQTEKVTEELKKRGLTYHHDDNNNTTNGDDNSTKPQISLCALSGMSSAHDVDRYRQVGVGMCLIGESLMRASDPSLAIRGLCLDPEDYEASQSTSGGAYTGGMKIVKVCGLTTPEDALVACRAGANLIGVIFAEKSKRRVSVEQAKEIVNAVRKFGERSDRVTVEEVKQNESSPVSTLVANARALERATRLPLVVGVFQNQALEVVKEIVDKCGLDMVQLHGSEGMEAANRKNFGVPALRVVDIELGSSSDDNGGGEKKSSSDIASTILKNVTSDPIAILLDTSIKGDAHGGGGTGKAFDWTIAESIQNMGLPVIIAGGLTPENIGEAVVNVRPWGVDVAGGVEASPGLKDHEKVQKFVGGAKKAGVEASKGF